jgi:predicted dehydrogenase
MKLMADQSPSGSHDLSAMRELVGMPTSVIGATLDLPFWTVLFRYPTFTLMYESGIDQIPRFDAHIEVYSPMKSVKVQWDTPYIKGLPVTMHTQENIDGAFHEKVIRKTYEDPYVKEMKALYAWVAHGGPVKTTAMDAKNELKIFQMIVRAGLTKNQEPL